MQIVNVKIIRLKQDDRSKNFDKSPFKKITFDRNIFKIY